MSYLVSLKLYWVEGQWFQVYIGSDNGLVPTGTKQLLKPMLTQIYVAIWRHYVALSQQRIFLTNQSSSLQHCPDIFPGFWTEFVETSWRHWGPEWGRVAAITATEMAEDEVKQEDNDNDDPEDVDDEQLPDHVLRCEVGGRQGVHVHSCLQATQHPIYHQTHISQHQCHVEAGHAVWTQHQEGSKHAAKLECDQ